MHKFLEDAGLFAFECRAVQEGYDRGLGFRIQDRRKGFSMIWEIGDKYGYKPAHPLNFCNQTLKL